MIISLTFSWQWRILKYKSYWLLFIYNSKASLRNFLQKVRNGFSKEPLKIRPLVYIACTRLERIQMKSLAVLFVLDTLVSYLINWLRNVQWTSLILHIVKNFTKMLFIYIVTVKYVFNVSFSYQNYVDLGIGSVLTSKESFLLEKGIR